MRKAIQIQVTHIPETSSFASAVIQTVVCDDGTMWHKDAISDDWEQVANIPQPAPEGDKP